jgi:probable phosphoglycerate mutase
MLVAHYLGLHLDMFQRIEIAPASLTIIAAAYGRPMVVQVNETSYLPVPQPKEEGDKKAG